ncbi:GreA/GreB family elongation factor [Amycolatopsis magusensis]|uniref:GreA/GreB family elongation factor n=1 Tax=Amycolatopsis magusensis TaxID=882444 RepID=UPI003F684AFC
MNPDTETASEAVTRDEQAELIRLRAENALLRTEKDILLKAATWFATDAGALLPPRTGRPETREPERPPKEITMTTSVRPWLTPHAHRSLVQERAGLVGAENACGSDDPDSLVQKRHRQARIRQIDDILREAVVGEDPPDDGIAEPGMVLTVRYDDASTAETFLLGSRDETRQDDLEVYSPDSPLGRALAGAKPGEHRTYQVPNGATVRVTLIDAEPYGRFRRLVGGAEC